MRWNHETGLPVAPSLPVAGIAPPDRLLTPRTLRISGLCIGLAVAASFVAEGLQAAIALITNFAYFGRWSTACSSPADNRLGGAAVLIPVVGALIIGVLARYGSQAIRGHGIPEAMEQVLFNESRIPARIVLLKPLASAIAIGTGGPFGAEGPIIATGGALGSLLGQVLETTAAERKTLLAAGAAAGMTATFGSPVAALLLAIELLLFELRPRSFVPVALGTTVAAAMHTWFHGSAPVFAMPAFAAPSPGAIALYLAEGAVMGALAVGLTRMLYAIEDLFERLPIHWMWWPALGAIPVGIIGFFSPHTLGVGYDNIQRVLTSPVVEFALLPFVFLKLISWSIALGSGTSGGTLAPLFTLGGGIGAALGALLAAAVPLAGVDVRVAALVGMAAMFAGASRALMASVVFAFEVTGQPLGLPPLLAGCTAAFLVSAVLMRQTIMTERLARRGRHVPVEYSADPFAQAHVRDFATSPVVCLAADEPLAVARARVSASDPAYHHTGFPVVAPDGQFVGLVLRRDILQSDAPDDQPLGSLVRPTPAALSPSDTLRHAADRMVQGDVGRLPVVENGLLVAILSRKDLQAVHLRGLRDGGKSERTMRWKRPHFGAGAAS